MSRFFVVLDGLDFGDIVGNGGNCFDTKLRRVGDMVNEMMTETDNKNVVSRSQRYLITLKYECDTN